MKRSDFTQIARYFLAALLGSALGVTIGKAIGWLCPGGVG